MPHHDFLRVNAWSIRKKNHKNSLAPVHGQLGIMDRHVFCPVDGRNCAIAHSGLGQIVKNGL